MADVRSREKKTVADIMALPEDVRAELIDGEIVYQATPGRAHQKISVVLSSVIYNYISSHGGSCEVYHAPLAVFLDENYLEPDIFVVCDNDKLKEDGCHGAPDWVIEIVSPGTRKYDASVKKVKYRRAGVKSYWLIYPEKRLVVVFDFADGEEDMLIYHFEDEIPVAIFEGYSICPAGLGL